MNIRQALLSSSSGQLARIAAAWDLSVEAGTLRRELVDLLAQHLADVVRAAATWAELDDAALGVLRLLVQAGGRHEFDLLARRLRGSSAEDADRIIDDAIGRLIERGLIVRTFESDQQRQGIYLLLPDEILAAGQTHLASEPMMIGPPPADSPAEIAAIDVASDLFTLSSALRREAWGAPSRGIAGRPPRTVGQILGRLRAGPAAGPGQPGQRWRFLLWVAQRAGWINRDPWPMPDDDALERLLRNPGDLPQKALSAGPVKGEPAVGRQQEHSQASPRRLQADTLQLLSDLPPDSWWRADALATWTAQQLALDIMSGVGRPGRTGQTERTIERWLAGRWYWLGLVEWGHDGDSWSVVRPARALRELTTGRPVTDEPAAYLPCILSENREILAPAGADLASLYAAEPYLTYAGSTEAGRHYRLTPPSLERGLRMGGSPELLLNVLERLTQREFPSNWRTIIEEWSSGEGRLELQAQLILSADRAETLAEARAVPSAEAALVEQLSPRHAAVAGDRLAALLTDLAAAGLPVQVDPGLRAEPGQAGRAAALAGSVTESAWIALEVARRLAPDVINNQRDLTAARQRLEAIMTAGRVEALGRRVASIMATIADRKPARVRRRMV